MNPAKRPGGPYTVGDHARELLLRAQLDVANERASQAFMHGYEQGREDGDGLAALLTGLAAGAGSVGLAWLVFAIL